MALRVVIVGPGRVGSAFGRRLVEAGVEVLGYIGRDPARAAAAATFAGGGEALERGAHPRAHVVLFAVGDDDLQAAVTALLAAAPPRSCSLWLHTSGCHGLEVFDLAAGKGARRGALHPVAPFADAESGYRLMAGQPAVLTGDDNATRLLANLARRLGMVAVRSAGGDRTLYHAACALAANGLVALRGLVDDTFAASGGLSPEDARRVTDALMTTALGNASEAGAAEALSGPVIRGDSGTVAAHLRAIGSRVPQAEAAYRALMRAALRLAMARGLTETDATNLRRALDDERSRS